MSTHFSSFIGPNVRSKLEFEKSVVCPSKVFAFSLPEFQQSILQPLRGVFSKEILEVLYSYIEISPVTCFRVLLELFPKASDFVTGNREFFVPERFAVFVGGLKWYETIGRFSENFTSISQRAVGSSPYMVSSLLLIISRHYFYLVLAIQDLFVRVECCARANPDDCDGCMLSNGSPGEELNIFLLLF